LQHISKNVLWIQKVVVHLSHHKKTIKNMENQSLTPQNILDIIQKYSLVVRCLPLEIKKTWYPKTDETLNEDFVESYWTPDDDYFKKVHSVGWLARKNQFYEKFPNGRRIFSQIKPVENIGGWWIVKQVEDTGNNVVFSKEHDFLAPTLAEAIEMFLKKNNVNYFAD